VQIHTPIDLSSIYQGEGLDRMLQILKERREKIRTPTTTEKVEPSERPIHTTQTVSEIPKEDNTHETTSPEPSQHPTKKRRISEEENNADK
jgi:hypothetical protein